MGRPNNGATNMSKDLDLKAIHETAINAAQTASKEYFNRYLHGVDQFPCGFAYVVINDNVRANSKLGKQLIELGYRKGYYSKRFERVMCSLRVQNVDVHEAGSNAYAQVLRDHGIDAGSYSRLD